MKSKYQRVIVTGGLGFIGSHLCIHALKNDLIVLNIDKVGYASSHSNVETIQGHRNYHFEQVDLCDHRKLTDICSAFNPELIMHCAAESHVDNSISNPSPFLHSNITGTYNLLETARLLSSKNVNLHFHHISTDEVYGDLSCEDDRFTENSQYRPSSPYSASKAASDHLVQAWRRTYGINCTISNCSNNYGLNQHKEKLIPKVIRCFLTGKMVPIYGDGQNIRDWLHVDDHVRALFLIAEHGKSGEQFCIGGDCEFSNYDLVKFIANRIAFTGFKKYEELMEQVHFVPDRQGHDLRYAIDSSKIRNSLGWEPIKTLYSGIDEIISSQLITMQA